MKKRWGCILAIALAVSMSFSSAAAAFAKENEAEGYEAAGEHESYECDPPLADVSEELSDAGYTEEESASVNTVKAANESRSGRTSVAKMTMEQVRSFYDAIPGYRYMYAKAPVVSGTDYSPAVLSTDAKANVLAWINYYRASAGLDSVSLSEDANLEASYGALCLAMNDAGLSHTPPQPADMNDSDYERAYAATKSSNLSARYGYAESTILGGSISGQMWDSSSVSNMNTLGHRRWLLDPRMLTTGAGAADNGGWYYVDIKVFGDYVDKDFSVNDYDFIAWPASGKNLTETFPANTPWSVTLNPNRYAAPNVSNVQVTLKRLNDGKSWIFNDSIPTGTGSGDCHFVVDNAGYGISNCIIFRPPYDDIDDQVGIYEVALTGITDRSGNEKSLSYIVEFAPMDSDISDYNVTMEDVWYYTGQSICPKVSIEVSSTELIEGTDYTVSYLNNVGPGTATAIVQGIGNYSGSVELEFTITKNSFITFDANGGDGAPDYVLIENGKVVIPDQVPVLDRMNFAGWAEDPDADEPQYQPGDVVEAEDSIVLYAVWDEPYVLADGVVQTANIPAGSGVWYQYATEYSCNYRIDISGNSILNLIDGGRRITWTVGDCGMSEVESFDKNHTLYLYVCFANDSQSGKITFSITVEHNPVTTIEAKAPACTEDGCTAELACSVCGAVFQQSEVIPATGHSWNQVSYVWSDDNSSVTASRTCKNDVSHAETETVSASVDVIRAVSCTENGLIRYTAVFSNGAFETQTKTVTVQSEGHKFGDWVSDGDEQHKRVCSVCGTEEVQSHLWGEPVVTKEATEDEEGIRTYTCTVCDHVKTEVIPKTDHVHNYKETVVKPTCTEQGYTIHKCEKCGDEYKDSFTEALGHSWDGGTVVTAPTYEDEGEMLYTCTRCSQTKTEAIPILVVHVSSVALNHSEAVIKTNDTLQLEAGIEPENAKNKNVSWKSSNPSVASVDQNGMVTAHTYGKAAITVTTEDGEKTASCQVQTRYYDVAGSPNKRDEDYQYFFTPVYWAADHKPTITNGYNKVYFGTGLNCKREDMITFLWRAEGQPGYKKASTFSDVDPGKYYYKAIMWAAEKGITKGYSSGPNAGKFGVGFEITREDTVTFIYRAAGKPKYSTAKNFKDVVKGKYYYDAIMWAAENGITNGYSSGEHAGKFGVEFNVLREDIVTFLYRYAKLK